MLFIGADHRGYYLKEQIKKYLASKNIRYKDMGNTQYVPNDDFPDFAFKVAKEVVKKPTHRGILICGSGLGVAMAANKVRGARAAAVGNKEQAQITRTDNNANIITLSGDMISIQKARTIIDAFLKTKFSTAKRHRRRVEKIKSIEQGKWESKKKKRK